MKKGLAVEPFAWRFVLTDLPIEIDGKLYKASVQCYQGQTTNEEARYCLDLEEIDENKDLETAD